MAKKTITCPSLESIYEDLYKLSKWHDDDSGDIQKALDHLEDAVALRKINIRESILIDHAETMQ